MLSQKNIVSAPGDCHRCCQVNFIIFIRSAPTVDLLEGGRAIPHTTGNFCNITWCFMYCGMQSVSTAFGTAAWSVTSVKKCHLCLVETS